MSENLTYKCTTSCYGMYNYKVHCQRRLKYRPYAQAGYSDEWVVDENGDFISVTRLYSYCTNVCTIVGGRYVIIYDWYSDTTTRHINAFFREIMPIYLFLPSPRKGGQHGTIIDAYTGAALEGTAVHGIDCTRKDPYAERI